ncbi:MAG: Clp protease N-terminal domain-containing protein, partial [Eggerthellales bacterium]|nr:Clp protease N-terminal domain-containing protein [Eggerthellales bacterium]
MRLDKLAVTAQEAFQAAMSIAADNDSATIDGIHLLKALLDSGENNLSAIIKRVGADPALLKKNVDRTVENGARVTGGVTGMSIPTNQLMTDIDNAVKIAEKMGDSYATSEHLLISLAEDKGSAGKVLNSAGV